VSENVRKIGRECYRIWVIMNHVDVFTRYQNGQRGSDFLGHVEHYFGKPFERWQDGVEYIAGRSPSLILLADSNLVVPVHTLLVNQLKSRSILVSDVPGPDTYWVSVVDEGRSWQHGSGRTKLLEANKQKYKYSLIGSGGVYFLELMTASGRDIPQEAMKILIGS